MEDGTASTEEQQPQEGRMRVDEQNRTVEAHDQITDDDVLGLDDSVLERLKSWCYF